MAPWKATSYSTPAVRAYAQRLAVAAFVSGAGLSALVLAGPGTTERQYLLRAGFTLGALLYTGWAVRREPRAPFPLPEPAEPGDVAHFRARQAERERTVGHP